MMPSYTAYAGASTASDSTATGVNYFKTGEDPPLKEDSEYPQWLWSIADPPPSLFTLERKYPEDERVTDENFTDVGPRIPVGFYTMSCRHACVFDCMHTQHASPSHSDSSALQGRG